MCVGALYDGFVCLWTCAHPCARMCMGASMGASDEGPVHTFQHLYGPGVKTAYSMPAEMPAARGTENTSDRTTP